MSLEVALGVEARGARPRCDESAAVSDARPDKTGAAGMNRVGLSEVADRPLEGGEAAAGPFERRLKGGLVRSRRHAGQDRGVPAGVGGSTVKDHRGLVGGGQESRSSVKSTTVMHPDSFWISPDHPGRAWARVHSGRVVVWLSSCRTRVLCSISCPMMLRSLR